PSSRYSFLLVIDRATTALSPLSLHDALPICERLCRPSAWCAARCRYLRRPALWRHHARAGDRSRIAGKGGLSGAPGARAGASGRSEEHTSELQSRVDLVCRLLLEKKNKETES